MQCTKNDFSVSICQDSNPTDIIGLISGVELNPTGMPEMGGKTFGECLPHEDAGEDSFQSMIFNCDDNGRILASLFDKKECTGLSVDVTATTQCFQMEQEIQDTPIDAMVSVGCRKSDSTLVGLTCDRLNVKGYVPFFPNDTVQLIDHMAAVDATEIFSCENDTEWGTSSQLSCQDGAIISKNFTDLVCSENPMVEDYLRIQLDTECAGFAPILDIDVIEEAEPQLVIFTAKSDCQASLSGDMCKAMDKNDNAVDMKYVVPDTKGGFMDIRNSEAVFPIIRTKYAPKYQDEELAEALGRRDGGGGDGPSDNGDDDSSDSFFTSVGFYAIIGVVVGLCLLGSVGYCFCFNKNPAARGSVQGDYQNLTNEGNETNRSHA